jgi:hypothetical protein
MHSLRCFFSHILHYDIYLINYAGEISIDHQGNFLLHFSDFNKNWKTVTNVIKTYL